MSPRSTLERLGLALVPALLLAIAAGPAVAQELPPPDPPPPAPLQQLDFAPFTEAMDALTPERIAELDKIVLEATFADLQTAMDVSVVSSVELATFYLWRTREYDVGGLQSMLELNPEALDIAVQADMRRANGGVRGPLDGVPISIKGNIGSGDDMHTSAGAAALAESRSDQDAFVTRKLRDAGAVIIGKANLSEWAGWIHEAAPGYSSLGGQPVNPVDPKLPVLGSSSGSAVGTSANLVAASVATETSGSLIAPSAVNGVVGIHPSLGLVSRDRVVPLYGHSDTPGPIARTVTDAATLLAVLVGHDENDPVTTVASQITASDLTGGLDGTALDGVRVGIYTGIELEGESAPGPAQMTEVEKDEIFDQLSLTELVHSLRATGADVQPLFGTLANTPALISNIDNGLRIGFADYIAAADPASEVTSIADVVAFNAQDPARYAPWGQTNLERSAASQLSREDYDAEGVRLRDEARAFIDGLLAEAQVDSIVSINNYFSGAYAIAGYPSVTVPVSRGLGVTFTGPYLSDREVIGYAFAFEQAAGGRDDLASSMSVLGL